MADSDPAALGPPSSSTLSSLSSSILPSSSNTFAAPLIPLLHPKPATRTYGRKPPPAAPEPSSDASVPFPLPPPALVRYSTSAIPETEFEPLEENREGDLRSDEVTEREGSGSSSPTRRCEQTDPTTEEEDVEMRGEKDASPSSPSPLGGMESDEEAEGALAYFKKNVSVLDALAAIDRAADEAEERGATLPSLPVLVTSRHLATSSPLTSLATSDPLLPSSVLRTARLPDSSSQQEAQRPIPILADSSASSPSLLQAIDDFLPPFDATMSDADDEEDEAVVSRPRATALKGKKARRAAVLDSDDDEEDVVEQVVIPSDSSIDSDQEMLPKNPVAVAVLSKKEKLAALAAKKKRPIVVEKERERSRSVMSEESDAEKKVKAKVSRKGNRMSKKEEHEMNQQTAAMKRSMPLLVHPRIKSSISISSVLSKASALHKLALHPISSFQPSLPTLAPTVSSHHPPARPSSSSSVIISDSPARLSSRAIGKQRATSPIDATPVQREREPTMLVEEDDDEDLPTVEQLPHRAAEKERKAAEEAAKAAFLDSKKRAALVGVVTLDDSDSDIEIEGAPTPRKLRAASVELEEASKTPRLGRAARTLQTLAGPAYGREEEEPSESQLVASARTWGNNLADPQMYPSKSKKGKAKVMLAPSADALNQKLLEKSRASNLEARKKKESAARRAKEAKMDREAEERVLVVDPKQVLAEKATRLKEVKERGGEVEEDEEDAADADFVLKEERGSDEEFGSGAEVEGSDDEEEERATSERDGGMSDVMEEVEEDEDESIPVGTRVGGRARIVDDDDDDESMLPPVEEGPRRVQLPAFLDDGGDGGFSQFFGTAFSQDVGAKNDVEGFFRAPEPSAFGPDPTFLGAVLINSAERAKDAERLEAGNAFMNEPATPREMEPPRQYINKKGFMTQTRPANLFEDSPSDSPGDSGLHSQSIPGSASFRMTQTQLAATQTPTQAPRGLARRAPLQMLDSFVMPGTEVHISTAATEEEEVEETQQHEVEADLETQDTEMSGLDVPSAGQRLPAPPAATPIRSAFDEILQATQRARAAPPKAKKERVRSEFVDNEAERSDDEDLGMGAGSGDEDENGLDVELDELVDNEEVEPDLREEQDKRANEAYMADRAKDDADNEARMKNVADGKQREKRAGEYDFDDDTFDDDLYGQTTKRGEKRVKPNASMAELLVDEETQSFALAHGEGSSVPIKDGEMDYLLVPDDDGEERSDEDEDAGDGMDGDEPALPRVALSAREAHPLPVAESRRCHELGERRVASPESYYPGDDSSPAPLYKITTRERRTTSITTTAVVDDWGSLDSQKLLRPEHRQNSHTSQYKSDSKEESQGNGTTLGANSSVTGFTKARTGAKAAYGGTLGGGLNGKVAVTSKQESRMGYRRNNFTT